jgi:hypothetical protein
MLSHRGKRRGARRPCGSETHAQRVGHARHTRRFVTHALPLEIAADDPPACPTARRDARFSAEPCDLRHGPPLATRRPSALAALGGFCRFSGAFAPATGCRPNGAVTLGVGHASGRPRNASSGLPPSAMPRAVTGSGFDAQRWPGEGRRMTERWRLCFDARFTLSFLAR